VDEGLKAGVGALSDADRRILVMISAGYSGAEAAAALRYDLVVIAEQLARIRMALGASSTAAAVEVALGHVW